jgi:hypothetical protein
MATCPGLPLGRRHGSRRYNHQRGAVERELGRLKREWALLSLRVRRIERVRLLAYLSILGRLAVRLDEERSANETRASASAA